MAIIALNCKRCIGGKMYVERDLGEISYVCINCGYRIILDQDINIISLTRSNLLKSQLSRKIQSRRSHIESSAFLFQLNNVEIRPITRWNQRV